MIRSMRHAARRLVRARGFTVAAFATLGLGIGATTAVFHVVDAVLLRPLPYDRPDRLVSISHTLVVAGLLRVEQSDASILFFRRHNRVFTHFGGYQAAAAALAPVNGVDAERVPAAHVNADVLAALRVTPLRGRLFTDADDTPTAAPVVLLGERVWARKFGGDPGILNRPITVDGVPHEVVGIVPASVRFPAADTALWLPLRLDPAKTESSTFDYQAIARLRDGVSIDAAEADLARILPELPAEFPGRMTRASIAQTHMRASVRPLADVLVGDIGRLLWIVLGASAFVLIVACANVANLCLVRVEERKTALSVQRALGAAPSAILMDLLSEGWIVALAGGAIGCGIAAATLLAVSSAAEAIDIPRLAEATVDPAIAGIAAVSSAIALLVVSAPLLWRAGALSTSLLASSGRAMTATRGDHRARDVLVVAQVALAVVLLVGAGLMARSVWRLRSVAPGFRPDGTISFRIAVPPAGYPHADASVRFYDRAIDAFAAIGGVEAAGAISKLPLDEQGRTDSAVFVEDRPVPTGALPGIHLLAYASPGYFAAAGIPFIDGRTFRPDHPPDVVLEAVVSRPFAERYWGLESPIGKRLRIIINGPLYTVVGVVGGVKATALEQPADQMLYVPLLPAPSDPRWTPRDLAVVVRTAGNMADTITGVRDAMRRLDPSVPIYRVRRLGDVVAQAYARRLVTLVLIGSASVVALLLGAIGLYGVMSYVVSLRTHEVGIRLALGARPGDVRRLISRHGLAVATAGIAIGLVGALALSRVLAALLFEVSPRDPIVLTAAAVLVLALAAAASWLPARRAAAVDPALALRAE